MGCELIIKDDKLIINQCKIILKLLQDLDQENKDLKFKVCPIGNLIKVTLTFNESNDIICTNKQVRYQSGVGSLLYIVKYSSPGLNNSVR